jgi:hypothetical protein
MLSAAVTTGSDHESESRAGPGEPRIAADAAPHRVESRLLCWYGATIQIRPVVQRKRVIGTRFLVMRSEIDPAHPDKDFLQGRHVIVDAVLKARSGGISFDTNWCTRNRIP